MIKIVIDNIDIMCQDQGKTSAWIWDISDQHRVTENDLQI